MGRKKSAKVRYKQALAYAQSNDRKPDSCRFLAVDKRRFCSHQRKRESLYCGYHQQNIDGNDDPGFRRIPCPLDPSHTVKAKDVHSHVKKCTAASNMQKEPYRLAKEMHVKDINAGANSEEVRSMMPADNSSADAQESRLLAALRKIYSLHQRWHTAGLAIRKRHQVCDDCLPPRIQKEVIENSAVNYASTAKNGEGLSRHVTQNVAFVSVMQEHNMLPVPKCTCSQHGTQESESSDPIAFIELGSGKGKTMLMIAKGMQAGASAVMLSLDTSSYTQKADKVLKKEGEKDSDTKFVRALIDIKDCDLRKCSSDVWALKSGKCTERAVGFGKHVCGDATDFGLRCSTNLLQREEKDCSYPELAGIFIACCCRHRCTWRNFTGRSAVLSDGDIGPDEFPLLTRMATWAICGLPGIYGASEHATMVETNGTPDENAMKKPKVVQDLHPQTDVYTLLDDCVTFQRIHNLLSRPDTRCPSKWSSADKFLVGQMCRQVIDMGRVKYCHEQGLSAELIYYTPWVNTPENVMLIATRKHGSSS
eukprot:Clim_evm49s146 gene=Clim_evmTU49s146